MSKTTHTPGPLIVKIDKSWPFRIRTLDASGNCVFSRDMPCYSTMQRTKEHVMSGKYMDDPKAAADAVEQAVADEVLHAAAPDLLTALKNILESHLAGNVIGADVREAQEAIAKATGAAQ